MTDQIPEFGKIAFESTKPDRGYTVRASYLKPPHNGDAMIEVFKDGQPLRRFLFPAYKIWNIAAHFSDIVDGEIDGTASGYEMTALTGFPCMVLMPGGCDCMRAPASPPIGSHTGVVAPETDENPGDTHG